MKLWLTRQHNGMYMLTKNKPIIAKVEGREFEDAYVPIGDPVGMRHFCDLILKLLESDTPLKRGESVQIDLWGKIIDTEKGDE